MGTETKSDAGTGDDASANMMMDSGEHPDAMIVDSGIHPDAMSVESGIHPDAMSVDSGIHPDAMSVDSGIHPDAMSVDSGIHPDAMIVDSGPDSGIFIQTLSTTPSVTIEWVHNSAENFYIMRTEATVAHYGLCLNAAACMVANHVAESGVAISCNYDSTSRGDNHPMNCVRYAGADEFCTWVGGELPTNNERMAEADPLTGNYPWAGTNIPTCDECVYKHYTLGPGCGNNKTWPVCSKPNGNSQNGACDMSGNVSEWTSDGSGWNCGGSWDSDENNVYSRSCVQTTNTQNQYTGFRCIRTTWPP